MTTTANDSLDPEIKMGTENSPAVMNLQLCLRDKGHVIELNGEWDAITDIAVREFQRNSGMTPDGVVTAEVWAKLRE